MINLHFLCTVHVELQANKWLFSTKLFKPRSQIARWHNLSGCKHNAVVYHVFFLQKKKHQIFDFPSIVLVHVPFIFLLKVDYVGILFHCLPWCDSTASPGDTNRPLATRPPRCSKSAVTALNGSIHLRDPERGKFAALKMAGNGRSFEGTPISRW